MAMSIPPSTAVTPTAVTSAEIMAAPIHRLRGAGTVAVPRPSGGSSSAIPVPPAAIVAPTAHATGPGPALAAQPSTTAGPIRYDSSPCTDSSAYAALRWPAVVIAAMACLVTACAGTISSPATPDVSAAATAPAAP